MTTEPMSFSSLSVPTTLAFQNATPGAAASPAPSAPAPSNPNMVGLPDGAQPVSPAGTATTAAPAGTPAPASSPFGGSFLFLMVGVMGLMILMQVRTGRKEKKKRAALMSSMKRGDKVQTIGGMIGTIVEIRDDDMVLKLEEGKVRVTRSSVATVLKESKVGEMTSMEVKNGREKASV